MTGSAQIISFLFITANNYVRRPVSLSRGSSKHNGKGFVLENSKEDALEQQFWYSEYAVVDSHLYPPIMMSRYVVQLLATPEVSIATGLTTNLSENGRYFDSLLFVTWQAEKPVMGAEHTKLILENKMKWKPNKRDNNQQALLLWASIWLKGV